MLPDFAFALLIKAQVFADGVCMSNFRAKYREACQHVKRNLVKQKTVTRYAIRIEELFSAYTNKRSEPTFTLFPFKDRGLNWRGNPKPKHNKTTTHTHNNLKKTQIDVLARVLACF